MEDDFVAGKIPAARYQRLGGSLLERLAKAQTAERTNGGAKLQGARRNLPERWDTMSVRTRRSIIQAVLESVEIAKANGNGPVSSERVRSVWRA